MLPHIALALAVLPLISAESFIKGAFVYHRQTKQGELKDHLHWPLKSALEPETGEDRKEYENTDSYHSGKTYADRYFGEDPVTHLHGWDDSHRIQGQCAVILPDHHVPAVQQACTAFAHGFHPYNPEGNERFCSKQRPHFSPPEGLDIKVDEYPGDKDLGNVRVLHSVIPIEKDNGAKMVNGKPPHKFVECKPGGKAAKSACSVPGRVLAGQVLRSFENLVKDEYEHPKITFSIGPYNAIPSFFHLAQLGTSSPQAEKTIQEATSVVFELV
ncbi:hypothetical protein ACHAQA_004114 [Verticillium albo-atrum]